jgi:ankyrin repeat protein
MRLLLEDEQTSELAHVLGDSLQTGCAPIQITVVALTHLIVVLHSGVKGGNVEIVELLLQHDPTWAEVRDAQGCTPLCLAFVQQNVQLVQLLLPRRQGGADWTCFHYSNDELRVHFYTL